MCGKMSVLYEGCGFAIVRDIYYAVKMTLRKRPYKLNSTTLRLLDFIECFVELFFTIKYFIETLASYPRAK